MLLIGRLLASMSSMIKLEKATTIRKSLPLSSFVMATMFWCTTSTMQMRSARNFVIFSMVGGTYLPVFVFLKTRMFLGVQIFLFITSRTFNKYGEIVESLGSAHKGSRMLLEPS